MFFRIPGSQRHLLSVKRWKTRLVFWSGAIAIGVASAGFAAGASYADHFFRTTVASVFWLPLLVTPAGLVAIAWITRRYMRGAEGSGIPQAIAALQSRDEMHRTALLSLRIAFGKIVLTLLGLFSGASIGREGPTVHVGAAIMYSIGRFAHFPRHDIERGLILAGSAAGIAAAFNTPLAGILFAIEEMSKSFEQQTSGTMLVAVVLAGIVAMALLGNYTYFGSTDATLAAVTDWIAVPVAGVVGGALGGGFALLLVAGNRRLRPHVARYPLRVAALCGFMVALMGLLSGGAVFGTGYDEARHVVSGGETSFYYPFLKIIATAASYFSGIPGGIFAPSLSAGAGLGHILSQAMPAIPATAVVILGMVAFFAGVVQTPITAFVIVMEMTDNQTMLLPLMATAFIAYGVSRLVNPHPIYQMLAEAFLLPPGAGVAANNPVDSAESGAAREPGSGTGGSDNKV
jgi:H+/Cl- antiporter ClcA